MKLPVERSFKKKTTPLKDDFKNFRYSFKVRLYMVQQGRI